MALLQSNFASTVPGPVNFVLMEELLSAARKRLPYFNGTLAGSLEKAKGSMELRFKNGMLECVDIRTDKQSSREVLGG